MRVSRSDVIFFVSIQRERCVTGEKAIASSLFDNSGTALVLTKRSRLGPTFNPGSAGFQLEYGTTEAGNSTLCGPTRRKYTSDKFPRQLAAACSSCALLISTWTSFCPSTNVFTETCGPTPWLVPNAGGAPAGCCVAGVCCAGSCASADATPAAPAATPAKPTAASVK